MDLRHYTDKPFDLDRAHPYTQFPEYKPRGFWVSVKGEDDWPTWCEAEGFRIDNLAVEYEVTLKPDARILYLTTTEEIEHFMTLHGVEYTASVDVIDWPGVAALYDGIIISPYQWSIRLNLHWYYGWDVASGCIWNLDAIESIQLLNEKAEA